MTKKKANAGSRKPGKAALKADKYECYQKAVQSPEPDIDFAIRVFNKRYQRPPRLLREDFCGTAALSCEFVSRHEENKAWGVDLDPEPLAWGAINTVGKLDSNRASRLELIEGNVLEPRTKRVDLTLAFNFSYCIFRSRTILLDYFRVAYEGLRRDGLFMLDLYGGPGAQQTMKETQEKDGFDYIWEQARFDPIQHGVVNHIHFEFEDGSRKNKAFTYEWRLWTIPEIRDLLLEAGFSDVEVYWEGTDKETGEGNGIYHKREHAIDDPAWVVYIVGVK
jgi:hypothetical protein